MCQTSYFFEASSIEELRLRTYISNYPKSTLVAKLSNILCKYDSFFNYLDSPIQEQQEKQGKNHEREIYPIKEIHFIVKEVTIKYTDKGKLFDANI